MTSRVLTLFCGAPRPNAEERRPTPTELRQEIAQGNPVALDVRPGTLADQARHVETARKAGYRIELDFRGPESDARPTPEVRRDLEAIPAVAGEKDTLKIRSGENAVAVIERGNAQMLATMPKWVAQAFRIREADRCGPEIGRILVQALAKHHGLDLGM